MQPFLSGPLALEEGLAREVSIDQLARFFSNPAKHLLEKRLGLFLREEEGGAEDREPMALQGLERFQVGDELLNRSLGGEEAEDVFSSIRAGGKLPLGSVGRVHYEGLHASVSTLRACAAQYTEGHALESLIVDRMIGDTRLIGTLSDLWPAGRVQVAYRRLGKASEFGNWIRHLCLCLVAPDSCTRRTILIGRAPTKDGLQQVTFAEADNPEQELAHLIELYWAGQVAPLPFFPNTARAFAAKLGGVEPGALKPEQYQEAMKAALKEFVGSDQFPGESVDPYVSQVFADTGCLGADFTPFDNLPENYQRFEEMASSLFGALLAAREQSTI
jgi:exodeoxyribonuclease V gamma subunit